MARGRTRSVLAHRHRDGRAARAPVELIVEEPLSIRMDDTLVATTMRTPGNDFELAVGFLHAEGLLEQAEVTAVRYCGTASAADTEFNVVSVETVGPPRAVNGRLGTISSSCGLCGAEAIDELRARLHPLAVCEPMRAEVVGAVADRVRPLQSLFDSTGAVHAAASFDAAGEILDIREDIGRHNAVDKVVGRLALDRRLPAASLGLFVSSRASFEMVQKAWAAGFGTLIAVGAPSALAVETARAGRLVLVGFARDGDMTVYSPQDPRWAEPADRSHSDTHS
ncbi:MAG: formate dehydrogenase accessory sulfurtransferase FdhD [Acidimicrobiia bacterium]|nr:formate dehydrogenase accessory sulfurtransferase FdhD [Acidimicrobiia bacterium]